MTKLTAPNDRLKVVQTTCRLKQSFVILVLLMLLGNVHLVRVQNSSSASAKLGFETRTGGLSSSMLRAYVRTNNMRPYHLDFHSYRLDQLSGGDAAHVDSNRPEHWLRCEQHLGAFHRLLETFSNSDPMDESVPMEALRLADAFGRPPAGLLDGHQFWLGSYEACLDQQVRASSDETVPAQYCLGLAQFPGWHPEDTKTSVKIGLCLPETCSNLMLNKPNIFAQDKLVDQPKGVEGEQQQQLFGLVDEMMRFQLNSQLQKLKLRSVYCLPHETSAIRQFNWSARLLITLLASFTLLAVYATICDHFGAKLGIPNSRLIADQNASAKRSPRTIIIESFSIARNIDKLMRISRRDSEAANSKASHTSEEFKFNGQAFSGAITGLKCVGLVWIIGAHTFLVGPITSNNLIVFDKVTLTWIANIYLGSHLMVDTFFAFSGLLASYLLFKSGIDKLRKLDWLVLTIHRYWRLTTVYIICYWFTKSLGHKLNTGPLWDHGTAELSPRYQCEQESWLVALLHLSDFKSPKDHCVPFAWFIANEIKFWILTPFLLVAIRKNQRRGYQLVGLLILANILLVAKLAFYSNVDMKSVIEFKPESADNMLNNMSQVYTRPYSRIGAYLIGLLAGHLFYRIETRQLEVRLSKSVLNLLWTAFALITVVQIFLVKLAGRVGLDDWAIPYAFSICSALVRPLWALGSCWLIFALSHNQARWLTNFLSANFWRIMAKLSFCAYLAQGEVIAHLYLSQTHSNNFTYSDTITRPIVATVLTMLTSFVLLILIEYPLIGIEELILPSKRQSEKEDQPNSASNKELLSPEPKARTSTRTSEITDSFGGLGENNERSLSTPKLKLS